MERKVKIIIIVILIVVILGICLFVFSKENKSENVVTENNTINEENIINNTINENIIKNEVEEIVEDPVEEEKEPNEVEIPTTVVTTTSNTTYQSQKVYESNDNVGTTDKKEQAINLVKEYWGPDDDATFRCDSVTTNGEYIIAVTSKKTATVSGFFRVNLENKTVEVEF